MKRKSLREEERGRSYRVFQREFSFPPPLVGPTTSLQREENSRNLPEKHQTLLLPRHHTGLPSRLPTLSTSHKQSTRTHLSWPLQNQLRSINKTEKSRNKYVLKKVVPPATAAWVPMLKSSTDTVPMNGSCMCVCVSIPPDNHTVSKVPNLQMKNECNQE